jgi:large subunit ribosomal protein L10
MPTDAKRQAVTDLADLLRGSSALAVADYRGLTVSEMHTVRRALRANGVSLKVAKNRLLKIAADEAGLAELKPMLDGPTAIASTTGDEVSLARALQDAFRPYKVVTLRGGLLAGQPVGAADLQRLATLPSREVLLGRLAGGMAAPLSGMAAVLAANLRNLVGVLSAVADQKRQTEGAAVEEPAAPEEPGAATAEAAEPAATDEATEAAETAEAVEPVSTDSAAEPAVTDEAAEPAATDQAAEPASTAEAADAPDAGTAGDDAPDEAAPAAEAESAANPPSDEAPTDEARTDEADTPSTD